MLLSATLLVILVRSIGSFWQLRWYWFRLTKPRTYAYGIISHMATVSTTISKEHQRCCYQQVRSKKHFVHPTFPLLIIQSMAARKPTTYIAWKDFRRWQLVPASIPWKPCLVCRVPPLRCFGIPKGDFQVPWQVACRFPTTPTGMLMPMVQKGHAAWHVLKAWCSTRTCRDAMRQPLSSLPFARPAVCRI